MQLTIYPTGRGGGGGIFPQETRHQHLRALRKRSLIGLTVQTPTPTKQNKQKLPMFVCGAGAPPAGAPLHLSGGHILTRCCAGVCGAHDRLHSRHHSKGGFCGRYHYLKLRVFPGASPSASSSRRGERPAKAEDSRGAAAGQRILLQRAAGIGVGVISPTLDTVFYVALDISFFFSGSSLADSPFP